MRRPNARSLAAPVALGLVALIALPMTVLATTTAAIAQTGGMTVVLPAPGLGLTVDVKLDASGNVSEVNLDPIPSAYSATKISGHAVTFATADGATQVKIRAGGSKLSVKASAGTLDALVGSGTWKANVFGTGDAIVGYTIGKATDGSPTVKIDSATAPSPVVVNPTPPTTGHEDHGTRASASATFSLDGYTKRLSIRVSVDTEGAHHATLSITLTGKDRQTFTGTLAVLAAAGTRTWSGKLCDGTAASFTYTVNADGSVTFGAASGATATSKTTDHGISVVFDGTKARVSISVRPVKGSTTDYALSISTMAGRCAKTPAPLPKVNVPVLPGADQPSAHHGDQSGPPDRKSGSHGGGHGSDGKGD